MSEMNIDELALQCEKEALHHSGAIQPFGALLRLDPDENLITHASENLPSIAGIESGRMIGQSIDSYDWLREGLSRLSDKYGKPLYWERAVKMRDWLDVAVIRTENGVLVEIERNELPDVHCDIHYYRQQLIKPIRELNELEAYHQMILEVLNVVTGLSRIMVYRFHPDWSGEVIAELAASGLGSYLGLRYPASDIPAIARNLYLLNPIRSIPDVKAKPVPIVGLGDRPVDLSRTDLRSVSPMHIQYLENMGVAASLSLPVKLNGQLWGLIAGHHHTSLTLSRYQRHLCIELVASYNLGLANYLNGKRMRMFDNLERQAKHLLNKIFVSGDPLDNVEDNQQEIMAFFQADGFSAIFDQDVISVGLAPDTNDMAAIDAWFERQADEVVSYEKLHDIFSDNPLLLATVSGMLAIKIYLGRRGNFRFFWFRKEEKQEIPWAGNPNKPILEKADAIVLSPRRSFEKWVEVRSGYSLPWTDQDKLLATKFRKVMLHWL